MSRHLVPRADPNPLVSLALAAESVDVSPRTLSRRIANGELTAYRLGRVVRVDLNELRALMTGGGPDAA